MRNRYVISVVILTSISLVWYYFLDRYACYDGFNISFPSASIATISCRSPNILIHCRKDTFSSSSNTIRCTSSDKRSYVVIDRTDEMEENCKSTHGPNSTYSNERCICLDGYENIGDRCISRDKKCKYLGENGIGINRSGTWGCGCESGYTLSLDQKECISILEACSILYGNNSVPKYDNSDNCICKEGFVWNESRTACNCPLGKYELNSKCVSKPLCGGKGDFDINLNKCICKEGAKFIDNSCYSENDLCSRNQNYFSIYNKDTKQCECISGYLKFNGKCENINSYCSHVYGDRSYADYGKENSCKCLGNPCKCTSLKDISDKTVCVWGLSNNKKSYEERHLEIEEKFQNWKKCTKQNKKGINCDKFKL